MTLGDLTFTILLALYFAMMFAAIAFLRWRRKSRWPFKQEEKLLRVPGEELRRKIARFSEDLAVEFFGGIIVGFIVFVAASKVAAGFGGLSPTGRLAIAGGAALLFFMFSIARIARQWVAFQKNFLGWFGERIVGEKLDAAKLMGWRVFHDVPFTSDGRKFNIDHVAVGAGGVVVFETKTRRKGNARPGRKDNEVIFNGRELDWPWGTDTHGLEQAERNAQYLATWIKDEIGERVHVSPYVVLPGWWLTLKPCRDARLCRVANPH